MRFLLLISIIAGFLLYPVSAQSFSYQRTLGKISIKKAEDIFINDERPDKPLFILHFNNCSYDLDKSSLPLYHELIPIPEHLNNVEIKILKVHKLDPGIMNLIGQLPDLHEEPAYFFSIMSLRKKDYLDLSITPFIKEKKTGTIYWIENLEIILSGAKDIKSQKKALYDKTPSGSILSTGKWIKLKITETGIYKITYDELISMGLSNPTQPRIFGNGGNMLPVMNNIPHDTYLTENAIWLEKGIDGVFNEGDYLLFFAEGPVTWNYDISSEMFIHTLHGYDEASYYFITSDAGTGKRIEEEPSPGAISNHDTYQYDQYFYHEIETENLIHSGKQWFEPISGFSLTQIDFPGSNLVISTTAKTKMRTAARSPSQSNFQISMNGQVFETYSIQEVNMFSYTSNYARARTLNSEFLISGDNLTMGIQVTSGNGQDALFWLDYIDINVRKHLVYEGHQMQFRDLQSTSEGLITKFHLQNTGDNVTVWDITDKHNIKRVTTTIEGSGMNYTTYTDSLREFIAFDQSGFLSPEIANASLENQDLTSFENIDMIIISPSDFISEAERLANFHRENDQLRIEVVTPQHIYNEFSSGACDPGAIRNFMKTLYDKATPENIPKYLLLFGDGSFDNRSTHENNPNFIPTYQSDNSLIYTQSYVTDDFYGLLDDTEGGATGLVDIGIGRIPVNSEEEATIVVDKILNYYDQKSFGEWRNRLCFVGDDEDNNIHMRDANTLCEYIDTAYPSFNIHKIFLDSYVQVSSPSGESYPEVNKAINEDIQNGTLIINYTGHGSERGLAHENILGINDINSWTNKNKLPLFITATCEFSRFDDIERDIYGEITRRTSAGELVLLNPEGGGIALLTTTRLVYSSPNFILNRNFYKHVFESDTNGNRLRLGDILRMTKNESGSGINKRNFTLLGDPALVLSYPEYFIVTDSINGTYASDFTDTLKALGQYTISGHITDRSGNILNDLNGIIMPQVYDKESTIKTLSNDGTPVMEFQVRDKIIYKGKNTIENGKFNFTFPVPKDISFKTGEGKIGYYFQTESGETDAQGYYQDFLIGGVSNSAETDNTGPEIQLFMNDNLFVSGGITDPDPVIFALVSDKSGINTLGTGIGHDIVGILDGNYNSPIILNNYYESDLDSYQSGSIRYPLSKLPEGNHSISLKVWDINNNSSVVSIEFRVISSNKPSLQNLINYPNPFRHETNFILEHNLADNELDVDIRIFSLTGEIIKTINERYYSAGYRLGPIEWDGKDDRGNNLGAGLYIYRISVTSQDGSTSYISGKMIKVK